MARSATQWIARPGLPDTHYVDNRIYTDEGLFNEEQEKIFRKIWKFVCHEGEVTNPLDFRTASVAGIPLVVVRSEEGPIRTFVNACSHRGAQILREPSGNARRWICPFHRWTYDTSGNCVAIPRAEAYAGSGIDVTTMGLREVRTSTYLGLVFVNLDDAAEPLADYLAGSLAPAAEVLGSTPLEPFHFHKVVLQTNWKLWQLTNLELYHEFMHFYNRRTNLSQGQFFERRIHTLPRGHVSFESFTPNYTLSRDGRKGEARSEARLPGLAPNEWRLVNLFPDLMINMRTTVVRLDCVIPLSPTKTVVEYRALGIRGESAQDRAIRVRHHNEIWGPLGRNLPEDNQGSEAQMMTMRGEAIPFSLHAREEGGRGQDDVSMRHYFSQWSTLMARSAAAPFGFPHESHGENHDESR